MLSLISPSSTFQWSSKYRITGYPRKPSEEFSWSLKSLIRLRAWFAPPGFVGFYSRYTDKSKYTGKWQNHGKRETGRLLWLVNINLTIIYDARSRLPFSIKVLPFKTKGAASWSYTVSSRAIHTTGEPIGLLEQSAQPQLLRYSWPTGSRFQQSNCRIQISASATEVQVSLPSNQYPPLQFTCWVRFQWLFQTRRPQILDYLEKPVRYREACMSEKYHEIEVYQRTTSPHLANSQ